MNMKLTGRILDDLLVVVVIDPLEVGQQRLDGCGGGSLELLNQLKDEATLARFQLNR